TGVMYGVSGILLGTFAQGNSNLEFTGSQNFAGGANVTLGKSGSTVTVDTGAQVISGNKMTLSATNVSNSGLLQSTGSTLEFTGNSGSLNVSGSGTLSSASGL